jgi:hypothetical protein
MIIVGGLLAAAGIGTYAWSVNPPPAATASEAAPDVLTAPTPEFANLTAAGRAALRDSAGPACDLTHPVAVLGLATTPAGPDLVVDQAGCAPVRFILGPTWGQVQPTTR